MKKNIKDDGSAEQSEEVKKIDSALNEVFMESAKAEDEDSESSVGDSTGTATSTNVDATSVGELELSGCGELVLDSGEIELTEDGNTVELNLDSFSDSSSIDLGVNLEQIEEPEAGVELEFNNEESAVNIEAQQEPQTEPEAETEPEEAKAEPEAEPEVQDASGIDLDFTGVGELQFDEGPAEPEVQEEASGAIQIDQDELSKIDFTIDSLSLDGLEDEDLTLGDLGEGLDLDEELSSTDLSSGDLPDKDVTIELGAEEGSDFLDSTNSSILFDGPDGVEVTAGAAGQDDDLSADAKEKLAEIDKILISDHQKENIPGAQIFEHADDLLDPDSLIPDDISQDYKDIKEHFQRELFRMSQTVKSLRKEKDLIERKLIQFENSHANENKEIKKLNAQLDEQKLEFEVLENKYQKLFNDLKTQVELITDKKSYLEIKNKKLEEELDQARNAQKVDLHQVRNREVELESKLNILKEDTEVQLRNRDYKILELKRKIDSLEFDIDSANSKEKKIVSHKRELEDKMNHLISTLRGALGNVDAETSLQKRAEKIKKTLDV